MTEITDAEAAEVLWASSDEGKAAVKAACDKARSFGVLKTRAFLTESDIGGIVYAAFTAAPVSLSDADRDWIAQAKALTARISESYIQAPKPGIRDYQLNQAAILLDQLAAIITRLTGEQK